MALAIKEKFKQAFELTRIKKEAEAEMKRQKFS
jgi:hypothetical protein